MENWLYFFAGASCAMCGTMLAIIKFKFKLNNHKVGKYYIREFGGSYYIHRGQDGAIIAKAVDFKSAFEWTKIAEQTYMPENNIDCVN